MEDYLAHPKTHHSFKRDPVWRLIPRLDGTSSRVVTILDEDGVICYQSRPICHLLGLRAETCVGQPLWDLLRHESRQEAKAALQRMTEDGAQREEWRFCFQSASGNKQWLIGKAVNFLKDPRMGGIVVYWEADAQETAPSTQPCP